MGILFDGGPLCGDILRPEDMYWTGKTPDFYIWMDENASFKLEKCQVFHVYEFKKDSVFLRYTGSTTDEAIEHYQPESFKIWKCGKSGNDERTS